MIALSPALTADAYALGLNMIAGGKAEVQTVPGGYVVRPSKDQAASITRLLKRRLTSRGEPAVKLDLSPIYMPVLFNQVLPVAVGLILIGYFVGRR